MSACASTHDNARLGGGNTDKSFTKAAECIRAYIRNNTGSGSLNMGPETAIAYYSDHAKVVVRDVNSFDTIATIDVEKRGSGAFIDNARFGFSDVNPFGHVSSEIDAATRVCR